MIEFIKKYWKWILLAIIIIIAGYIYLNRRKKQENAYDEGACRDCGQGGINSLTIGLYRPFTSFNDTGKAEIGSDEYKRGRQIAIDRFNNAKKEIDNVVNIPGVVLKPYTELNPKTGEYETIVIDVQDEATQKKVNDWVAQKNLIFTPNVPGTYGGYPVKVKIVEVVKA